MEELVLKDLCAYHVIFKVLKMVSNIESLFSFQLKKKPDLKVQITLIEP